MNYADALLLFFVGFFVHSEIHNKGIVFSRVHPPAVVWAELVYALRVVGIFQLVFTCVVSWNAPLFIASALAILMTFRGYTMAPRSYTNDELVYALRTQALSALAVYGGFLALTLLT